jgi:hypothetical protein
VVMGKIISLAAGLTLTSGCLAEAGRWIAGANGPVYLPNCYSIASGIVGIVCEDVPDTRDRRTSTSGPDSTDRRTSTPKSK